ncbi:uncharacterized protein FA14DRAFT_183191 [Meira miltonrushii]|uniref:Uncharacterized protein n=1 Tax=Meira miltonrushii TaxID=1280837 RepID=A0A316VH25_9BASI|nr:uncharacterized protein FA14DRAFT_183191 [Meira miltonrushii]PWN36820.1 hypothetical protein FA14DRAFT_183191 [Meira miltonrushii]
MRFITPAFSLIFITLAFAALSSAAEAPAARSTPPNAPMKNDGEPDFFYFGANADSTGRSMLANDEIISQAMKWGQKFYIDQLVDRPKEFLPSSAFDIPSVSDYDHRTNIGPGADYMLSCYTDEIFNLQHKLNVKCSKKSDCDHSYFVTSIWGTVGKMDWEKDGIIVRSCAILIVGGEGCKFPDGPTCTMSLYRDLTKKADAESVHGGQMHQFGPVTSLDQVTKALKKYAKKTKQQITLPDGTLTRTSK